MQESRLVTLKLIGFNDQESKNLHAILTLAYRALTKKWLIVSTDEADFFLLSASADPECAEMLKNLPPERCLFCTNSSENQTERSLQVDAKGLPRLSVLVALCNRVTANPAPISETPASPLAQQICSPIIESKTDSGDFFDPHQGLLGYLVAADHTQLLISLADKPDYAALYIDVEKNTYYTQNTLERLHPYVTESAKLNIKACSKLEIQNYIVTEHLKPRFLKELIWYIVMKTSAGKVIKDHASADIVTLKAWPDLKLFKCASCAKVATFMKNNAAPLAMIAEQTRMPLSEVHNFYNACYLMGLIEKRNQIEINKKNLSANRLDLLNKIDARLK